VAAIRVGHIVGTPWKDDDEKQIMVAEMRLFMEDRGAVKFLRRA
jgi:hypothetical protein